MGNNKVIEIYKDTKGREVCNGTTCRERLTWAEIVASGKKMCFSGDPAPVYMRNEMGTGRVIEALPFDKNHWATCPDRAQFARRKRP